MAHNFIATDLTLWTYRDAVDHLMDVHQLKDADVIGRRMRRAIDTVYRELPYRASWSYYSRDLIFTTAAPQSTGTIAYTAATRTVTLSGATWPGDVTSYRIRLNDLFYEIESRDSDTVIVLSATGAPATDISAGATYQIFRAAYQLPYRFREVRRLWDVDSNMSIPFSMLGDQFVDSVYAWNTPGTPRTATIRNGENLGWLAIYLSPPPDAAIRYAMSAIVEPRQINLVEHANIATVGAGDTSVTVTGTLPESIAGSLIRFSSSATAPTSKYGSNKFVAERRIISRDSSTTLTIEGAISTTLTSVACSISDPIDIEPGAMLTAFQRGIELEYARLAVNKDVEDRDRAYHFALQQAIGNDRRISLAEQGAYPINRLSRVNVI